MLVDHQLPLFDRKLAPATPRPPAGRSQQRARPQNRLRPTRVEDPLTAFFDHLIASGKSRHSVTSARLDLSLLGRFVQPTPLGQIQLRQLRLFVRWLAVDRGNKPSSLRRKIATLKAFSHFLFQAGVATTDVATRLPYPRAQPRLPRPLSADEAQRILRTARQHSPLWHAVLSTLLETGLKRDELLSLRPSDVVLDPDDLSESFIRLQRRRDAERTRLRSMPVTRQLHTVLQEFLPGRPNPDQRLFELSPRGVDYVVEACGHLANVRTRGKLTPQLLRDTFAIRRVIEFIQRERTAAANGASPEQLLSMHAEHDAQLLRLLGLSTASTVAERYREAVEGRQQPEGTER